MRARIGRWSSAEAERRFRMREDELWRELMPAQPERLDLATSLGPTRAYRWPGTGVPFVMLHGMGGTSLMWAQYVATRNGRTMYAIDTIGDVGRSVQRVPFRDAAHLAQWLDETLAALDIDAAHLVGASYGGWIALVEAVVRPRRVASLALLEPAGLAPIDTGRFMLWGACVAGGAFAPARLRRRIAVWTRNPIAEDRRMVRFVLAGQFTHRLALPRPEPLADDDLRTITAPMLVLLGAQSELHRPAPIVARLRTVRPDAHVEVVAGAGHALPVSHAELVRDRLDAFVTAQSPAAGPGTSRGA